MKPPKIRVLIGKIGLDGHDRGAKIVARALRDAGMEVVYTGIRQGVDDVVSAAVQEDVAVLGLSFLSGDHMTLVPRVIERLKATGRADLPLVIGGIILKHQMPALMEMGVRKIFFPGTAIDRIVADIQAIALGNAE
jgi:methylmalonyl-CoA mutase C-terminal domain/subunit